MNTNQQKKLAAESAVEEIESGMIIGLGTGSTVQFALEKISEKLKSGELKNIHGIPSSMNTEKEAKRLDIPLITLDEALKKSETRNLPEEKRANVKCDTVKPFNSKFSILELPIDLTIDGADEFTVGNFEHDLAGQQTDLSKEGLTRINLIKGGGGALLREKILAQASKRLIIITDESKRSKYLGEKLPVPVEVVQMAFAVEKKFLDGLGADTKIRRTSGGNYFVTDEGNFIIDANFGMIKNVRELSALLNKRAGIVEHGLFVSLASKVFCALSNGKVEQFCAEK